MSPHFGKRVCELLTCVLYIPSIKLKLLTKISQLNVKAQSDYWGLPATCLVPGSEKLCPKRIRWKVRNGHCTIPSRLYLGSLKYAQPEIHYVQINHRHTHILKKNNYSKLIHCIKECHRYENSSLFHSIIFCLIGTAICFQS